MKRRILLSFVAAVLAVPFVALQPPAVVHADGHLDITSVFVYDVDPAGGAIHVQADLHVMDNDIVAQEQGMYYYAFSLVLPVAIRDINNSDGHRLNWVNVDPILFDPAHVRVTVGIRGHLTYHRAVDIRLTYNLVGTGPRSPGYTRLDNSSFSFEAIGVGDPGLAKIKINAPSSFSFDKIDPTWSKTTANGITSFSGTLQNADTYGIVMVGHDGTAMTKTNVSTDAGKQFLVESWPADTQWRTLMDDQIRTGVPALQKLIGLDWPMTGAVDVRESLTPYAYGYAGWFTAATRQIEVGEDLDPEVMLHELSHAWFNEDWFKDRWLNEGFAQVYSNLAIKALGGTAAAPKTISTTDAGAVTLDDWSDPTFQGGDDAREQFGYNASFWVVQQLIDEIGTERMQKVLAMVDGGQLAYPGNGPADKSDATTDWRRFLDLMENIGGSKKVAELLEQYVVSSAQRSLLNSRTASRATYANLVKHGGSWSAPLVVRRDMSDWTFTIADRDMKAADGVLALRDQLDALVKQAGTTYPATLQQNYENASRTLDSTSKAVKAQIDAANHLLTAMKAKASSHGVFGTIGLWGTDLDSTLNEARAAFAKGDLATANAKADEVITAVHDETSSGLLRVGLTLLAILMIVGAVLLVRRSRRKKALAAADASAVAAAAIEADGEQGTSDQADMLSMVQDPSDPAPITAGADVATDAAPSAGTTTDADTGLTTCGPEADGDHAPADDPAPTDDGDEASPSDGPA